MWFKKKMCKYYPREGCPYKKCTEECHMAPLQQYCPDKVEGRRAKEVIQLQTVRLDRPEPMGYNTPIPQCWLNWRED